MWVNLILFVSHCPHWWLYIIHNSRFQTPIWCSHPENDPVIDFTTDFPVVTLENDLSSSQPSVEELPDFLNLSYETLHNLAGLSNHDDLIYDDWDGNKLTAMIFFLIFCFYLRLFPCQTKKHIARIKCLANLLQSQCLWWHTPQCDIWQSFDLDLSKNDGIVNNSPWHIY